MKWGGPCSGCEGDGDGCEWALEVWGGPHIDHQDGAVLGLGDVRS